MMRSFFKGLLRSTRRGGLFKREKGRGAFLKEEKKRPAREKKKKRGGEGGLFCAGGGKGVICFSLCKKEVRLPFFSIGEKRAIRSATGGGGRRRERFKRNDLVEGAAWAMARGGRVIVEGEREEKSSIVSRGREEFSRKKQERGKGSLFSWGGRRTLLIANRNPRKMGKGELCSSSEGREEEEVIFPLRKRGGELPRSRRQRGKKANMWQKKRIESLPWEKRGTPSQKNVLPLQ